ncbi:MAG: GGDEF domain-containing protein [Bacilli bacterium]|nr:GGDEF domain-containing protein [Bacilli bacterium]
MKNKKLIWIIGGAILVVAIIAVILTNYLSDPTRLSISEKNWLNDNLKNVQNISVLNDDEVFGKTGTGVFFDFLNDFTADYSISINPVAYNSNEVTSGLLLGKGNTVTNADTIFYKDHYVLIGKNYELIKDITALENKNIGIASDDLSYVSSYLKNSKITFMQFTNEELQIKLTDGTVEYILVPLMENLHYILTNNLSVNYHFGDINYYYYLNDDESIFSSILKKYYLTWKDTFNDYFNASEFNLFTIALNISGTEVDALRSIDYKYGFVNNSPYEVIIGGNYGGIVAIYLQKFSDFSGVNFTFTKYKNYDKFVKGLNKNEIDIYYNYYNLVNEINDVKATMPIKYEVIASAENNIVINSLESLQNKEVYVLENSLLQTILTNVGNVKVKTYKNTNELFKLCKKDIIALVDSNIYDYYKSTELEGYTTRYSNVSNSEYSFKVNNSNALYKLFNKYVQTLDYKEMTNEGIYHHYETMKSGTILGTIAKYILYILVIAFVAVLVIYKKTKKITVIKRIKREDKLKFVDQLTSLKNRNYLNENIETWNNNNVYPQAMIVIDLNNVQYINDSLGYEEGDKQIKAVANVLIKTQLDYTDIIRTDGNEFLVYMVGYSQKQVVSYIHKLNKEFKKLPYEYGAEFGYSMITDDIKTIEDAINEAVEEMKKQKKEKNESDRETK